MSLQLGQTAPDFEQQSTEGPIHVSMGADARRIAGIRDGLLHLSVGLEDEGDLVDGLKARLAAVGR